MAQIISGNFDYTGPIMTLVKDLGWQDISARKRYLTSILMYKCINRLAPNYLCDKLHYYVAKYDCNTRNSYGACLYLPKTKNSFVYNGFRLWNDIPHVIRDIPTLNTFNI